MDERRRTVARERNGGARGIGHGALFLAGKPASESARGVAARAACCSRPIPSATRVAARRSAIWTSDRSSADPLAVPDHRAATATYPLPGRATAKSSRAASPEPASSTFPTAHLSNLERPRSFNAALLRFPAAARPPIPWRPASRSGRAMLGDAHVDRARRRDHRFHARLSGSDHAIRLGPVWQRPGLDDRTRRLLALTATAALGRWEEFRMHVAHGPRRRPRTVRSRRGAPATGGLRRRSRREHRVPNRSGGDGGRSDMQRDEPPFRADHVGSLLRPAGVERGARALSKRRDRPPTS